MLNPDQELIILTVCTKDNHHLKRLQTSADQHNITLNVIGMGEEYLGNGKKRVLLHQFLKTCNPNAVFMYVDAFDIIFLTGEQEIREKYFKYYEGEFLLGAEQNFGMYSFDDLYYFLKYPVKNNRFKYLNAGTMMGPVNKGIQLLETLGVTNEKQASDQMDMIRYLVKNPTAFKLDHDHHIFGVNGGRAGLELTDYTIKNDRLYSNITQNWPSLLHVPGKFFIGLDQLSKQLGFMDSIPEYTKAEEKAYLAAKKDHELCDRLGIENYTLRLIKNWTTNGLIVLALYLIIKFCFGLIVT